MQNPRGADVSCVSSEERGPEAGETCPPESGTPRDWTLPSSSLLAAHWFPGALRQGWAGCCCGDWLWGAAWGDSGAVQKGQAEVSSPKAQGAPGVSCRAVARLSEVW